MLDFGSVEGVQSSHGLSESGFHWVGAFVYLKWHGRIVCAHVPAGHFGPLCRAERRGVLDRRLPECWIILLPGATEWRSS